MKNFTLALFVFAVVMISIGCSEVREPRTYAKTEAPTTDSSSKTNVAVPAPKQVQPECPKTEEVSKDYSDEDVVGFYFQKRLYDANPGEWKDGQVIEVKRLQGIVEINHEYSEKGDIEVRLMNNLKKGGMSGFAGVLPKGVVMTFCGKTVKQEDLYQLIEKRRMIAKGSFKLVGEREGSFYEWQKLDLCHIE